MRYNVTFVYKIYGNLLKTGLNRPIKPVVLGIGEVKGSAITDFMFIFESDWTGRFL